MSEGTEKTSHNLSAEIYPQKEPEAVFEKRLAKQEEGKLPHEYSSHTFEPLGMLEKGLIRVGFNESEAKVYYRLVTLGKSRLHEIAKHSGMNHVTTLYTLRALQEKGLVERQEEGSLKYYTVRHPRQGLWEYMRKIQHEAEEKENLIKEFLEGFEVQFSQNTERPEVKFIEGEDVSSRIELEIEGTKFDQIYSMNNQDEYDKFIPKKIKQEIKKCMKKYRRRSTTIYASSKGNTLPKKYRRELYYYVPSSGIDFPGELLVFGDKIILFSYQPSEQAIVIRNQAISKMMTTLFRLAIHGTRQYKENEGI